MEMNQTEIHRDRVRIYPEEILRLMVDSGQKIVFRISFSSGISPQIVVHTLHQNQNWAQTLRGHYTLQAID
jgi:hypothetical protein